LGVTHSTRPNPFCVVVLRLCAAACLLRCPALVLTGYSYRLLTGDPFIKANSSRALNVAIYPLLILVDLLSIRIVTKPLEIYTYYIYIDIYVF